MTEERLIAMSCPKCGSNEIIWKKKISLYRCLNCDTALSRNNKTNETFITNSRYCENCGTRNILENKCCIQCGQPLLQICPDCSQYVDITAKYCPNCSTYIKDALYKKKKTEYQSLINKLENKTKNNQIDIEKNK